MLNLFLIFFVFLAVTFNSFSAITMNYGTEYDALGQNREKQIVQPTKEELCEFLKLKPIEESFLNIIIKKEKLEEKVEDMSIKQKYNFLVDEFYKCDELTNNEQ